MAVKHVLPVMRAQQSGVILTISSLAAYEDYPYVTYKATKAAMIAFTQQVAIQNAQYGVRANCILPGLMDTPMAVDTRARSTGKPRAEVLRPATPRCRCAARWAPPGTSPMQRCFSPPTRPISSPAWPCRSTAAHWSRSVTRLLSGPIGPMSRPAKDRNLMSDDASFSNADAPRRGSVLLAAAAFGLVLAGTVALWAHYGTAIFFETIRAGLAACFG